MKTFICSAVVCPDCGRNMDTFNEWRDNGNHQVFRHSEDIYSNSKCPNSGKLFLLPVFHLEEVKVNEPANT